MPIQIPPIYQKLDLREYDKAMPEQFAQIWLNPSLAIVRERADIARETIRVLQEMNGEDQMQALEDLRPRRHAWLVSVLDHGQADPKRWTPDLLEIDQSYEASPDFVRWLTDRVTTALDEHLAREKKD